MSETGRNADDFDLGDAAAKVGQTRFLNRVLLAIVASTILLALAAVLNHGWRSLGVVNFVMVGAALLSGYCSYRGLVKRGLLIILCSAATVVLVNGFFVAGTRTPLLASLSTILVVAALILDRRVVLAMAAVVIAGLVGLTIADVLEWLPPARLRSTTVAAEMLMLMMAMSGAIGILIARNFLGEYRKSLALARDLQHRLDALRSSEARFSTLFRASPIPCLIADKQSRAIVDVNDSWLTRFALSREATIGRTAAELGIWRDQDQRAAVIDIIDDDSRPLCWQQLSLGAPGQTPRTYLTSLTHINVAGTPCILSTLLDQTDRLTAESARQAMNADLEAEVQARTVELAEAIDSLRTTREELIHSEKLASLGALVATISHELSTPIGTALVTTTSLQKAVDEFGDAMAGGQLKRSSLATFIASAQEMLKLTLRSADRAATLISSFKQVAIDQTSERRREFDLQGLVEDVVATLRPGMKNQPWVIAIDVPPGISCDSFPGPLGQVVTNLVQNAALHGLEGCAQGNIRIHATQQEDSVVLSVSDDGNGMPADTLQHIFDPFFTTRLSQGGSGLGLSICQRIASTVLGGTLDASSVPGEGSTFTLRLPLMAPGKM